MISTEFTTNIYITSTTFSLPTIVLFEKTIFLYLFSYISVVVGYTLVCSNKKYRPILFSKKVILSHYIIYLVVFFGLTLGLLNFLYNVYSFSGGSIKHYMASISVRSYQYADSGGTALFYNFMYIACYLWFYLICAKKTNTFEVFVFSIIVILSIFIMSSQGRIFLTLAYGLSFIGIKYTLTYMANNKVNNLKFFLIGFAILLSGLLFYVLRAISSLSENNMLNGTVLYYLGEFFTLDMLGYYAVDKGNIPNPGVVMKMLDSWENDVGFLYGESLITWIYNILPTFMRPEHSVPSVLIKETWYSHIQGGNLPPTGPGEMLANFGFYGAFIGMMYFGGLCGVMTNCLKKHNNFWVLSIYILLSLQFFALYPKVEFENLRLMLPIMLLLAVWLIKIITTTINSNKVLC